MRCARTLRRQGFDGSILIVGSEPSAPYNRPPLSKELLRDDLPDELVLAEPEGWYDRRAVVLRTDATVTGIDPEAREATLADGSSVGYGRCLIATGAEPRRLPIPGGGDALLLRTLPDARRLRAAATEAAHAAPVTVIGGGFIGVEVASGLAALGLRPTVVEMAAQLWGGSLGTEVADWARDRLSAAGIEVRTDAAISRLESDGAWIGDERLPHAFSIAGIGVVPRTDLARAAGLEVDDGVVVDGAQRTSDASIWAAGDVARVAGQRRVEHWHAARESGERAAVAMLGESPAPVRPSWLFSEVAGHHLDVVGLAAAWDETVVIGDMHGDRFVVGYIVAGIVIQIAIVNDAIPVEDARALVGAGASVAELSRLAGV